ncbi:MAG TPA: VIT family protein [Kiritimatiellia bacterium]|nr:VIT family protein [Kiritimatiellia bacterium]
MRLARHLDTADALAEILFGLIMVLTFTLAAGFVASEGAQGVREIMIAAIGCNLAWGIIDAAMYVMSSAMHRGRRRRFAAAIRAAPDEAARLRVVAAELGDDLGEAATPADREAFFRSILRIASHARAAPLRLTRSDWLGAWNCFYLVAGTTIPAILPFLVLRDDPFLALRVSNHLLALLLFAVGFTWARETGLRPWRAAFVFLLASLALVYLAIALGG